MAEIKFESTAGAKAAQVVLKKSLAAIGSSKIKLVQRKNELQIDITDKSPSKQLAARYGANRLANMLAQIDKAIK